MSLSQKCPQLLWNPKAYYRVDKGPPLVPVLRLMNPVHTFPPYSSKVR